MKGLDTMKVECDQKKKAVVVDGIALSYTLLKAFTKLDTNAFYRFEFDAEHRLVAVPFYADPHKSRMH